MTEKDAVLRFVGELKYTGQNSGIGRELAELRKKIGEWTELLYSTGQKFSGWNFDSLVEQKK